MHIDLLTQKIRAAEQWFHEKRALIRLFYRWSKKRNLPICRMGDVYFAKIGINVGAEMDKHRPVLVYQGSDYTVRKSNLVFVFPITSNVSKGKYKVCFSSADVEDAHLMPGAVLVQHGRTISKTRLGKFFGRMRPSIVMQVHTMFLRFLYKNIPPELALPEDTQTAFRPAR